jgi:RHS repeat-associated protein
MASCGAAVACSLGNRRRSTLSIIHHRPRFSFMHLALLQRNRQSNRNTTPVPTPAPAPTSGSSAIGTTNSNPIGNSAPIVNQAPQVNQSNQGPGLNQGKSQAKSQNPNTPPYWAQPVSSERFAYDAVGNRVSDTQVSHEGEGNSQNNHTNVTQSSYDDANELVQSGGTSYRYDGNGNRIEDRTDKSTTDYSYDGFNQLKGIQKDQKQSAQFAYDPEGRLIQSIHEDQDEQHGQPAGVSHDPQQNTRRFSYAGHTSLDDWDGNNQPVAEYYSGNGETNSKRLFNVPGDSQFGSGPQGNPPDTHAPLRGNMVYFMHDGLGSVCGLTNRFGEQVDAYQTQAYGSPLSGKLNDVNDQLLTGKRFDTASSLYYFGSRWYQPGTGTFMSQDSYQGSAMDPMSQNKYAYVNDNPASMVDPWGYSANYVPQPQGNFFSNLIQNRIFQGIVGAGLFVAGAALVIAGAVVPPLALVGTGVALVGATLIAGKLPDGMVGVSASSSFDGNQSNVSATVNNIPVATLDTSPQVAPLLPGLVAAQQANNTDAPAVAKNVIQKATAGQAPPDSSGYDEAFVNDFNQTQQQLSASIDKLGGDLTIGNQYTSLNGGAYSNLILERNRQEYLAGNEALYGSDMGAKVRGFLVYAALQNIPVTGEEAAAFAENVALSYVGGKLLTTVGSIVVQKLAQKLPELADALRASGGEFSSATHFGEDVPEFISGKLNQAYEKHRFEFGNGNLTEEQFNGLAQYFISRARSGYGDISSYVRNTGETVFFDHDTGEFGIVNKNNKIMTFFKPGESPDEGYEYYLDDRSKH